MKTKAGLKAGPPSSRGHRNCRCGDLLKIVRLDAETGLSEAAFTRKGVERATSGTGALAVIDVVVVATMASASELSLTEVKLSTAGAGIYEAPEQAVSLRTEAATSTASEDEAEAPRHFRLHGAYPNPFNPATTATWPEVTDQAHAERLPVGPQEVVFLETLARGPPGRPAGGCLSRDACPWR